MILILKDLLLIMKIISSYIEALEIVFLMDVLFHYSLGLGLILKGGFYYKIYGGPSDFFHRFWNRILDRPRFFCLLTLPG